MGAVLVGACGDQRRDQQSLTQVQATSFLLLQGQKQTSGADATDREKRKIQSPKLTVL